MKPRPDQLLKLIADTPDLSDITRYCARQAVKIAMYDPQEDWDCTLHVIRKRVKTLNSGQLAIVTGSGWIETVESGALVLVASGASKIGTVEPGGFVGAIVEDALALRVSGTVGEVEHQGTVEAVLAGGVVDSVSNAGCVGAVLAQGEVRTVGSGGFVGRVDASGFVGRVDAGGMVGVIESGGSVGVIESGGFVGRINVGGLVSLLRQGASTGIARDATDVFDWAEYGSRIIRHID